MNDVNLNSPDLRLVGSSTQGSARASTSPQNEGSNASAQFAPSSVSRSVTVQSTAGVSNASGAERLDNRSEEQREQLDQAVSKLNDFVQTVQRDLQFEVDNDLGKTIVRVVDQETQEVVRQIPDEVALRLAKNLQQDEPLTLFTAKV